VPALGYFHGFVRRRNQEQVFDVLIRRSDGLSMMRALGTTGLAGACLWCLLATAGVVHGQEAQDAVPSDWPTYSNPAAGYAIAYPPGWRVDELVWPDARWQATFSDPQTGRGVAVSVASAGQPGAADQFDLPNQRCEVVTVAGLPAFRCFDTLAFSTSTVLVTDTQTFALVTAGRGGLATYDAMLNSFTLLGAPDQSSQPLPTPQAAPPGPGTQAGLCAGGPVDRKPQPLCPPP
jgi:hypothetical protein